jgi:hypothetical protein
MVWLVRRLSKFKRPCVLLLFKIGEEVLAAGEGGGRKSAEFLLVTELGRVNAIAKEEPWRNKFLSSQMIL